MYLRNIVRYIHNLKLKRFLIFISCFPCWSVSEETNRKIKINHFRALGLNSRVFRPQSKYCRRPGSP
jgi:hypothetical protein